MIARFGTYVQHSDTIACGCGNKGAMKWERNETAPRAAAELVRIEGSFYERLSRKPPYAMELVCGVCGSAQRGTVQPEDPAPAGIAFRKAAATAAE